jgi:hypothetical protein
MAAAAASELVIQCRDDFEISIERNVICLFSNLQRSREGDGTDRQQDAECDCETKTNESPCAIEFGLKDLSNPKDQFSLTSDGMTRLFWHGSHDVITSFADGSRLLIILFILGREIRPDWMGLHVSA